MQQEASLAGMLGFGDSSMFGPSWDKFWFRLSNKALVYVNSDSGEGSTINLEDIVAVMPEEVGDQSCLLLKVITQEGVEHCHRVRALPDEHGHDSELLQEWKLSILMSVEGWRLQCAEAAKKQAHSPPSTAAAPAEPAEPESSTAVERAPQPTGEPDTQALAGLREELTAEKAKGALAEREQQELVAKLEQMREREVAELRAELKESERLRAQQASTQHSNPDPEAAQRCQVAAQAAAAAEQAAQAAEEGWRLRYEQLQAQEAAQAQLAVRAAEGAKAELAASAEALQRLHAEHSMAMQAHQELTSTAQQQAEHAAALAASAEAQSKAEALEAANTELKAASAEQEAALQSAQAELASLKDAASGDAAAVAETQRKLADTEAKLAEAAASAEAAEKAHAEAIAAAGEANAEALAASQAELEAAKEQHIAAHDTLREEHAQEVHGLTGKQAVLEVEARQLCEDKAGLQAQVDELESMLLEQDEDDSDE
eukprot:TRINITY_DN8460_c0_g2_i5.p1 TRINITY_DN8460_c0_g2~~TRINITY_DN8460_c0_g2_i5.p1  ORF type:complete len:487 (-),score=236.46 TRINITY_DN8460_c0_g2_i5:129-1589(-)